MKTLKSFTAIALALLICVTGSVVFCSAAKKLKAPKLTVKNSAKGIKASWKKVKGASKYKLMYKKTGSKKFKTAYNGKKKSFTVKKLKSGTSYTFKVQAKNSKKSSAYSKKAKLMYLKQPKFTELEEKIDMNGIHIKWSKVDKAEGYRIYRSLKYKNSYKKIATVKSDAKRYFFDETVKDPANPTQINSYKYYIKAYKGKYSSAKSTETSEVYGYYKDSKTPMYLTIKKGQEYKDINTKLSKKNLLYLVTWKTSDKSTVKVSDVGVIKGVKKGQATLTASVLVNTNVKNIRIIVTVK